MSSEAMGFASALEHRTVDFDFLADMRPAIEQARPYMGDRWQREPLPFEGLALADPLTSLRSLPSPYASVFFVADSVIVSIEL
ncbi:hypothetical protein [Methylobacterium sp. R2-1]|uniref:hypothetical protein n=1 Tax=Methylobacterium sp. R2-1 TaxID=2587064 RepID=UPI001607EBCA|nr:hypothetical protein [Methylobacterium sp. R2-1]MBB2962604.1 hypothetical protein [Methylobacterium sp. R2-1]